MKSFKKIEFNESFDHESGVLKIFNELGFYDLKIKTSFTNGLSHYIDVIDFKILNEGKLYADMWVYDGETTITVRISDHTSNLDTICGGVDGNRMNLGAFKHLIESGAIAPLKS